MQGFSIGFDTIVRDTGVLVIAGLNGGASATTRSVSSNLSLFAWRWWCLSLICARDPAPALASLALRSRDYRSPGSLGSALLDLPRSPGSCLARDRPSGTGGYESWPQPRAAARAPALPETPYPIKRYLPSDIRREIELLANRGLGRLEPYRRRNEVRPILSIFTDLEVLEIGGPSAIFEEGSLVPVYEVISCHDAANYASSTLWGPGRRSPRPRRDFIAEATALGCPDEANEGLLASQCPRAHGQSLGRIGGMAPGRREGRSAPDRHSPPRLHVRSPLGDHVSRTSATTSVLGRERTI